MKFGEILLVATLPAALALLVFSIGGEKNTLREGFEFEPDSGFKPPVSSIRQLKNGWRMLVSASGTWNDFRGSQVEIHSTGDISLVEKSPLRNIACGRLSDEDRDYLEARIEMAYLQSVDEGLVETAQGPRRWLGWSAQVSDATQFMINVVLLESANTLTISISSVPQVPSVWGGKIPPDYIFEFRDKASGLFLEAYDDCSTVQQSR